MATSTREHWFVLLGALRYVTDTFGAESEASEDIGVVAIHSALTMLRDIASTHVGGIRPTGMMSTLKYRPPTPPDVTHTLTLELFPVESIELTLVVEEETQPSLPDESSEPPE